MRSVRVLLIALLAVIAFYAWTTHRHGNPLINASWVTRPAKLDISQAASPEQLDPEEQVNVAVYKKVVPSVVNITSHAVAFDFFYGAVPEEGQGSGFIIDKQGHILTNYHVIANARQLEVTLHNRKKFRAAVVGYDKSHDLAVVQIQSDGELTPATLGESQNLMVGQKVFAIGNPFGLNGTMTRGIISSIRSVRSQSGAIDQAIQTDASINPGNSGGPLLNSHGDVIGINTMILTGGAEQSAGVGFAIPINTAKAALNDLIQLGHMRRPSLGIRSLPIGPELAQQMGLPADYGVLIIETVPGGAAERAGLRGGTERAYIGNTPILLGGDLIVAIDDQRIETLQDISEVLNHHRAGDTVGVTVYRGQRKLTVKVVLGEAAQQT
jgi:S1-C subfamily serine protease